MSKVLWDISIKDNNSFIVYGICPPNKYIFETLWKDYLKPFHRKYMYMFQRECWGENSY